jgi:hypothetical protein
MDYLETKDIVSEEDDASLPTSRTVAIYLQAKDADIINYIEKQAEEQERAVSWIVRKILRKYYKEVVLGVQA